MTPSPAECEKVALHGADRPSGLTTVQKVVAELAQILMLKKATPTNVYYFHGMLRVRCLSRIFWWWHFKSSSPFKNRK